MKGGVRSGWRGAGGAVIGAGKYCFDNYLKFFSVVFLVRFILYPSFHFERVKGGFL